MRFAKFARRAASLAIAASLLAAPWPRPAQADDAQAFFRPSDPELAAASAAAQASLPVFFRHIFGRSNEGMRGTRLLVMIGTPPEVEALWVTPFFRADEDHFTGHIEGLPQRLEGFMIGQKVTFDRMRILDWAIHLDDGLIYGDYLERARRANGGSSGGGNGDAGPHAPTPVPVGWTN